MACSHLVVTERRRSLQQGGVNGPSGHISVSYARRHPPSCQRRAAPLAESVSLQQRQRAGSGRSPAVVLQRPSLFFWFLLNLFGASEPYRRQSVWHPHLDAPKCLRLGLFRVKSSSFQNCMSHQIPASPSFTTSFPFSCG